MEGLSMAFEIPVAKIQFVDPDDDVGSFVEKWAVMCTNVLHPWYSKILYNQQ